MLTAEQIEAIKDRDEICELANKLAEDMAPSQFELDRRALLRDRDERIAREREIVKRLREKRAELGEEAVKALRTAKETPVTEIAKTQEAIYRGCIATQEIISGLLADLENTE